MTLKTLPIIGQASELKVVNGKTEDLIFVPKRTMKVGLVQINNSFSGASYLPLSAADLQVYAERNLTHPESYKFKLPIYKRMPADEAVEKLEDSDLVGFSLYCWNKNLSREIARKLKEKKPDIIIVAGGPEVPDRVESFLRQNPFIDIACHNEGEQAFVHILEKSFLYREYRGEIPSISFIDYDGRLHQTKWLERMRNLDIMPSPYISGTFDALMAANPNENWLGLWETNRGCPFSCTFCDWGSNTKSKVMRFDIETLYKELEWFAEHKIEFIYCCDANFGIFPRDVDIARKAAEVKAKYGYPHALSVQNAKNAEERIFQAQKILADAGLNKGVTLAFQSQDPEVLKAIERDNISLEDFRKLQKRFTAAGVDTYSDMIIALPKETYGSFANGIALTIKEGQHNRIQFGNLSMMPNAPMSDPEYIAKYGLKTVEVESVIYHGTIDEDPMRVPETEDIVIETSSMSKDDWARTRVFCWMTSLLHFDKIFQIPFMVLAETTGVSYRDLVEVFTEGDLSEFPVLSEIREFFSAKARSIQLGGIEQCPAKERLNLYWPPDEYIFIKLCREEKLDQFYEEAKNALFRFYASRTSAVEPQLLKEATAFNRALIKLPFEDGSLRFESSYNIREFCQGIREMRDVQIERGRFVYEIDRSSQKWSSWDEWMRYVVWYGNKRGAYLYGNRPMGSERGGHF